MRKVKPYIASPYTNGNKEELVKIQIEAAYQLLMLGFNPYAPLFSHYISIEHLEEMSSFDWLEVDKQWLENCDMLVRLHVCDEDNNEILSPGADEEERYAKELGIPVFHFQNSKEMVRMLKDFETTI